MEVDNKNYKPFSLLYPLTFNKISARDPITCKAPSFFLGSMFGSVRIW